MEERMEAWRNHSVLLQRIRKTFYYGNTKKPLVECSSLPLTEVTVDLIEKTFAKERRLDKLDVNYASFILQQACLSPASVMIAMIYLDRLKSANPEYLHQVSSCEMFIVSLVVASKFLFDKGEDDLSYNDEWASIANLDIDELNRLEREFLTAINWRCFVDPSIFMEQLIKFEAMMSLNEFSKRSDLNVTYIELISLFKYLHSRDMDIVWKNLRDLVQSIAIMSVAYCVAIGVVYISFSIVFSLQLSRITLPEPVDSPLHSSTNFTLPIHLTYSSSIEWNEMHPSLGQLHSNHADFRNAINSFLLYKTTKSTQYLKC